ncbi:3'-5' exonuclease [Clostridium tarantellae]|uniref:Exonuclease n=1 Tax=Clostridium tarantellae TaxID=39493 RepID=A0A6I1MTM4_9CLOT|nr:3'-5' exonuclease [Clostridium tarantellae]MPQ43589.1 exonuclease [Clostridium tarantellae]
MGYVIIDLEFNNLQNITKYYPNIYKENKELRDSKVDNEIIEIGAVKLNKFMQKVDEYRTFIKPSVFKVINPKIVQITGITQEQIEKGISFQKAMDQLKSFFEEGDILCSWATDDIVQIIENAKYHGYEDINWIKEYLDIQEYCTKMLAHKKSLSLKNALEELKIKVDKGSLHDALNDASYTAEVFKRLYNNKVVKGYIVKDVYSMPSSRVKDLKNYNADNIKVNFVCPKCKINVDIEHPLKLFSWRFISIGKCPKCKSNILQEVILKKTLSGDIVYNNINTFISNIEYIDYVYKFKRLESR